ncbi:MAG: LytR/AlgR family response regulator transcription factor [Limosilactobacillus pontis]|uniref:DNA-binding response regulator n=1 Tax=Limosilactobacillus pontis TaxID=35787 RepID=A0A2J6NPS1_9LACO|nr:LytTR family DNA-binding domain-containing protein [Limosilactobacillus pontis]PMB83320.1 DNA-binding response regulator [Limosilactobacillus pontis]
MKVLIVDDEPLARDELHYLVEQNPQVTAICEADGVVSAQQVVDKEHPDLMFLDIQLTDGSGMALAERLKSRPNHPYIVFATAYDQYALDAFKADAVDYLLKPFSQQRVNDAIKRVAKLTGPSQPAPDQQNQQTNPRLSLTNDERTIVLQKDTIFYIQTQDGMTTVWAKGGHRVVSKQSLTGLLKQLDPAQFIRIHRSFAVNLNMVSELQPSFNHTYQLTLKDGSKVPVSRSYVATVKQALGMQ